MGKRILNLVALLYLPFVMGDTHVDKKVSVKEVVFDSPVADLVWLEPENRIVLARTHNGMNFAFMDKFTLHVGRLYRSENSGDSWKDVSDNILAAAHKYAESTHHSDSATIDGLIAHATSKSWVMISTNKLVHFMTEDSGLNWRILQHQDTIHTYIFHPVQPKWGLLSSWTDACDSYTENSGVCKHMLYLTKDGGRTFQLVTSYVVQFSWGDEAHKQQNRIYFSHFRSKSGHQKRLTLWNTGVDFVYTDDEGSTLHTIVQHGNKFLVSNKYIFVAKVKDVDEQTVTLEVSSDGGNRFKTARLPIDIGEKSYTILDTSEGGVMIQVNHGDDAGAYHAGIGHIYISDESGIGYSLSLAYNLRNSNGDCEFEKIHSLDGIYIANQRDPHARDEKYYVNHKSDNDLDEYRYSDYEEEADGSAVSKRRQKSGREASFVKTVITFTKGAIWDYLDAPKVDSLGKPYPGCESRRCYLHLHGISNYHNFPPVYSSEKGLGLIMGTGNVGDYLSFEEDEINTFLSRDGGKTWIEAHKGIYIYEIAAHGDLVVMADMTKRSKQVVFSWNEGQSWYDFDVSEQGIMVENIVTDPSSSTTKLMMYGTRGGDSGVVFHLDFTALNQPTCKGLWAADTSSSDFETWSPSAGGRFTVSGASADGCLLGKQTVYTRRKQSSECFNNEQFQHPVEKRNCECTRADFECEIGFIRVIGDVDCQPYDVDKVLTPDEIDCTSSGVFFANAYRKIPGDTCVGGFAPTKVQVPCPSHSRFSGGASLVLVLVVIVFVFTAGLSYIDKFPKLRAMFGNLGFESLNYIRYSTIGGAGKRAHQEGDDFIQAEMDDMDQDAPKLMTYTAMSLSKRNTQAGSSPNDLLELSSADRSAARGAENVPKLQPPKDKNGDDVL